MDCVVLEVSIPFPVAKYEIDHTYRCCYPDETTHDNHPFERNPPQPYRTWHNDDLALEASSHANFQYKVLVCELSRGCVSIQT